MAIDDSADPGSPAFVEGNSINLLQYINSFRWKAHDEEGLAVVEVFGGHVGEWRAKAGQRTEDCATILFIGANINVKVFGGARLRMKTCGIAANDKDFVTLCSLKADKSATWSGLSLGLRRRVERVGILSGLPYCFEPLSGWKALPIAEVLRPDCLQIRYPANRLVHSLFFGSRHPA